MAFVSNALLTMAHSCNHLCHNGSHLESLHKGTLKVGKHQPRAKHTKWHFEYEMSRTIGFKYPQFFLLHNLCHLTRLNNDKAPRKLWVYLFNWISWRRSFERPIVVHWFCAPWWYDVKCWRISNYAPLSMMTTLRERLDFIQALCVYCVTNGIHCWDSDCTVCFCISRSSFSTISNRFRNRSCPETLRLVSNTTTLVTVLVEQDGGPLSISFVSSWFRSLR